MDYEIMKTDAIINSLLNTSAYLHSVTSPVLLHETHISWVLLSGNYAYKIKKPIVTDFLDYGTLSKRHHACCEELRLGNRYASGLYLDVVPITFEDGEIRMDGDAQPIEFAVRMRRFEDDALLSQQLAKNGVSIESMSPLASAIASFHQSASKTAQSPQVVVARIYSQSKENFDLLLSEPLLRQDPLIRKMDQWAQDYFDEHREDFVNRAMDGFIRECHGDLHCSNIVHWNGNWVPFDGIEFNSELSSIDVVSDIAFLVMDLRELAHPELSAALLNAYLEQTGDYAAMRVLRWYLVYRALVRAKVAVMRARQMNGVERLDSHQLSAAIQYIRLADQMTKMGTRRLWITHGLSGSGKTTGSQQIVEREGAVRIRSDIERKRLFKTSRLKFSRPANQADLYSPTASEATYAKLLEFAKCVLLADFDVIVDATFLRRADRKQFQELAVTVNAQFFIVDFQLEESQLRQRIANRLTAKSDASDATLAVLANQIRTQEHLTAEELDRTVPGERVELKTLTNAK